MFNSCKTCPLKNQCTKLPKRIIQRSEYQYVVDINDSNIKQNPHNYKWRQAICEHPFGSIKKHWGYTYTLVKGLQKVNDEMSLTMFCYNFMRTNNILGFEKMLQTIKNWQPDYTKIVSSFKKAIIKTIYGQNEASFFCSNYSLLFLKAV